MAAIPSRKSGVQSLEPPDRTCLNSQVLLMMQNQDRNHHEIPFRLMVLHIQKICLQVFSMGFRLQTPDLSRCAAL